MIKFIRTVDYLSETIGKTFGWTVLVLTASTCYEVFRRYVMNDPTDWAFDMSYMLYGALFLMSGAYTLAKGGHVRGDFMYRKWQPRTQAKVDFALYLLFFFPGVLALVFSGFFLTSGMGVSDAASGCLFGFATLLSVALGATPAN